MGTSLTCVVCGRRPTGTYILSMRGEPTCDRHGSELRCSYCSRVGPASEPDGWRVLDGVHRCPTCARDAVETQADVRRELPGIRATARELGFALRIPVRVTLTSQRGLVDPTRIGVTRVRSTGSDVVCDIQVLAGLPFAVFGLTVAHELGHAWLAQTGARPVDPAVEEGFCELIAYGWLRRTGGGFADQLRTAIRENPDPLYGGGFRLVHRATAEHGLTAVVAALAHDGTLPRTQNDQRTPR
jgi:hypothetical protein